MEESLSSGLPSGWEQGAHAVPGWGAANIPPGYPGSAGQPLPGYPLLQQQHAAHSPYGPPVGTSRYGTAGSPLAYGITDPAAYRGLPPAPNRGLPPAPNRGLPPAPIGYEAANLHSRYGLIDSPQDYRTSVPHPVYDNKGHNSGYSTPDHAVGYPQSEYVKSEPSSGFSRSDSSLHYDTAGSHSPYRRSEPTSEFVRSDPARGYDRREAHPGSHSPYDRLERPADFARKEQTVGYDRRETHSGSHSPYDRPERTADFARTDPIGEYNRRETHSGSHSPYDRQERASDFAGKTPVGGYNQREIHSEYEKRKPQLGYERAEPSGYGSLDPVVPHTTTESHSGYEKSAPTPEYDTRRPVTEYDRAESQSEYKNAQHSSEIEKEEHKPQYEKSKYSSEYETTEQPSENNEVKDSSDLEKTQHPEYLRTEETNYSSEHDKPEHPEYLRTEETNYSSEHDKPASTVEEKTEEPTHEYDEAVPQSLSEAKDSALAQASVDSQIALSKPDLPPGWERKYLERDNEVTGEKQTDTYYMSPMGDRLYSKNEVIKYCQEEGFEVDLKLFEFGSQNEESQSSSSDQVATEDTTENDKVEHPPETEKEISLDCVKKEKPDPSDQEMTDCTTEKDTEEPASGLSHSIFENDSSSPWGAVDSPQSDLPPPELPPGWERQMIERKTQTVGDVIKKRVDTYYISPTGKKLRSKPEIMRYCQEHGLELDLQLFGFPNKRLGSPAMPSSPSSPKTPRGRGRGRGRGSGRGSGSGKYKGTSSKAKGPKSADQEVEKILDHREASGGDTKYYVKWFGYHENYNSWETMSSLGPDAADLIEHYWARTEAQSQINQNILNSIMQIHSNGGPEDSNEHVAPEEHTEEIPSYFPQHFLSSSFYEEPEPVVKKQGKARRGGSRGRGGRGVSHLDPQQFLSASFHEDLEPIQIQNTKSPPKTPKTPKGKRKEKTERKWSYELKAYCVERYLATNSYEDAIADVMIKFNPPTPPYSTLIKYWIKTIPPGSSGPVVNQGSESGHSQSRPNRPQLADGFTDEAVESSGATFEDPNPEFHAALQCEAVMQEGSEETSVSQESMEAVSNNSRTEVEKPVEPQENKDETAEEEKPVEHQEKKKDGPETVIVPELAGKPRCHVLASGKMHEKEIDAIIAHQTKGVKEIKYFVRYFTKSEKEEKSKVHAWIFLSELKDCKDILQAYWDKRNAANKPKSVSSGATQSRRPMQQAMSPAAKKVLDVIDLSDEEDPAKKNMAKPSQPLGQQQKQLASSISSWHKPVVDEPATASKQEEYQVERVMLHRKRNGRTQYLVKWKDYPQSEATWEPEENLKTCKSVLDAYHKRKIEKVVFHRDLNGKREYLIKWEGFFSRHNSWETRETCSHLQNYQTHVNEYWRRKQEEADRKRKNLEECQQYYNTAKEREKRRRVETGHDGNRYMGTDNLYKNQDDDMEPSFLIKLCLLNTSINSLRCDRCGQQTLQFHKADELSLTCELTIKCTKCPDVKSFSTTEPSTNEPFLDIGGGEYIPLETEAQPVIVPVPVPTKKINESKDTFNDKKEENVSSGNKKSAESEGNVVIKTEINIDEDESVKKIKIEKEDVVPNTSEPSVGLSQEPVSSSSHTTPTERTTTEGVPEKDAATSTTTTTAAASESITQSSTPGIEQSNEQQDKEPLLSSSGGNLENSTQDANNAKSTELSSSSQNDLNKETSDSLLSSDHHGASESTTKVQSPVDDDDDIIMTEPEDPLCL